MITPMLQYAAASGLMAMHFLKAAITKLAPIGEKPDRTGWRYTETKRRSPGSDTGKDGCLVLLNGGLVIMV